MQRLYRYPGMMAALEKLKSQQAHLIDLSIQVQQIPAPTNDEGRRAAWVERFFQGLGLSDIYRDELNNVYGCIRSDSSKSGSTKSALLVSAHTDTVFPLETDLTVQHDKERGRIYGAGIGDNSTGVASLLALAEHLLTLKLPVDVWLVANSGEEGIGDLRGMRAVVDRLEDRVGASIVIEGMGVNRVVHRALGSRRFRITANAPGGHSWSDFGTPSAIHILAQLAASLTQLKVPKKPRTTFNIGRIEGGTSVNTIAQQAWLELDLRSEAKGALNDLIEQVLHLVAQYQTEERQQAGVSIEIETIGDRPTGDIEATHPLVRAAVDSLVHSGFDGPPLLCMSSTDANIPLSRGIPSVCVGITNGGDAHRLTEWIHPDLLTKGMQSLLMLACWTALWLAEQ